MDYKLKNNRVVDDDMLEEMAAEWESGEWNGHLENVLIGLPKQDADDLATVSFRLPKSRIAAVEAATKSRGISKSEFYRCAVDKELAALV